MRIDVDKVDFVMPWVDDTDPRWRKDYNMYKGIKETDGSRQERFRNWDNLKYWFRGIEKFAPWVNNVFLITSGQCPEWLNLNHPKVHLIDHQDYIPSKYLPVFSSHPIELNMHRISGLSETFVYFNDDIFITRPVEIKDFFVNGQPKEMAVEFPLYAKEKDSFEHILMNMSGVLNSHFNKRTVIHNNKRKWFAPIYGKFVLNNICMSRFGAFSGILTPHFPSSHIKSRIENVWREIPDILDQTCSHRFRSPEDINQYIFRFWNIMTGEFVPTNFDKYARFIALSDQNADQVKSLIEGQKYKILCINDSTKIENFENVKQKINASFNVILGDRSSFEN